MLRLSTTTLDALRELAQRANASPFAVLLAAFDAWLYRLTGATDIVVAVPVAHRQYVETMPLLGVFLNTLALRANALDGFSCQHAPFEQVVDAVEMIAAYPLDGLDSG